MADQTQNATQSVNTKEAERREIAYAGMDELIADLDAIQRSYEAGTLETTGNWTAGQIMRHSAILMECALDGFPGKPAPWPVRKLLKMFFLSKALTGAPPPAGFKIPKQAGFLDPGDASFDEGIGSLRRVAERVKAGEKFTHPSPIFEKLSHEQWCKLGLGHAALHMSFIRPAAG